jgi:hypothetical protein
MDRNRVNDLTEARQQLEESKVVSQAIAVATSKIKEDRLLAPNGSNFEQWTRDLRELGRTHLNSTLFFETPNRNSILERIGQAIFLASIHGSLVHDVQTVEGCDAMYVFVQKKFKTVSRAAQMNVWRKFLNFRIADHPSPAGIASKLRDLATEWKTLGIQLNEDVFMAFILQNSLTPNTPVTEDFERRVEHAIQQDPSHVAPSFDKMVHTLDMCRQQEELSRSKSAIVPGPSATASYEASTGDGLNPNALDHSAYLAGVPEEQWPEAMHFYEVTTNRCFSCGKADHYIRDCPTRARGLPFNRKSRGPGALSFRPAQPRAPAPTLAPFYPFVGAMYPPPGIPYQPPVFPHQPPPFPNYQRPQYQQSQFAPPVPPQQPTLRPADSWRPPPRPYPSSSQRSAPHSSRSTTSGGGHRQDWQMLMLTTSVICYRAWIFIP